MDKNSEAAPAQNAQVVYIVTRWGQIVGVYGKFADASQVAQVSIAKGQVCDIITKYVQYAN